MFFFFNRIQKRSFRPVRSEPNFTHFITPMLLARARSLKTSNVKDRISWLLCIEILNDFNLFCVMKRPGISFYLSDRLMFSLLNYKIYNLKTSHVFSVKLTAACVFVLK